MSTDTQTTPDRPTLTVEVTATVKSRQKVDVVALFANLSERDQQRYRTMDIAELGMEHEWERPLAYLWPDDDVLPMNMIPGHGGRGLWSDIDESDIRVTARGEVTVFGRENRWTEDDFNLLKEEVGWLRTFHAVKDNPDATPEDLSRIPGPADVPIF